ncbi:hypothetical protein MRX96_054789 [Rhipicephalus microplus]
MRGGTAQRSRLSLVLLQAKYGLWFQSRKPSVLMPQQRYSTCIQSTKLCRLTSSRYAAIMSCDTDCAT